MSGYLAQDIQEAINQLPDHHRTVIVLRYLQDLSYNEIADCLNLPLNTVKSYLFRARQQLQNMPKSIRKVVYQDELPRGGGTYAPVFGPGSHFGGDGPNVSAYCRVPHVCGDL